jgi:hypothetical protein
VGFDIDGKPTVHDFWSTELARRDDQEGLAVTPPEVAQASIVDREPLHLAAWVQV